MTGRTELRVLSWRMQGYLDRRAGLEALAGILKEARDTWPVDGDPNEHTQLVLHATTVRSELERVSAILAAWEAAREFVGTPELAA